MNVTEILDDFPDLEMEDIQACLVFCGATDRVSSVNGVKIWIVILWIWFVGWGCRRRFYGGLVEIL